jgi:REP element-mobilizing transposase RayT
VANASPLPDVMKSLYDPAKHHRRSIRLHGYDYASPGTYFITIITHNRECLFDNIVFRRIAEWNWNAIPRHFENVFLDEWIVMPNHIHGIIIITDYVHNALSRRRGEAFANAQSALTLAGIYRSRFPENALWRMPRPSKVWRMPRLSSRTAFHVAHWARLLVISNLSPRGA